MQAARATAPGKIILFGEHAVVYGQPAIAVPLRDVCATAVATPGSIPGSMVIVAANLARTLILRPRPEPNEHALVIAVRRLLDHIGQPIPALQIVLSSTIPIASGLGSGAAATTAVLRAVSAALDVSLDDDALNDLVYEIEKLHHGTPSGIDNTVVVFEKPVYFMRDKPLETFDFGRPVHLVVADTGISSPTHLAVGDVRALREGRPAHVDSLLDRIGDITRQAREAISAGDVQRLGVLALENHTLLRELTVSSSELDRLVAAATDAGACGAKLSGGGRGGNMIAFVTPETSGAVGDALRAAGAARIIRTVVG
ncbi:MAG: mevalonate kinase [Anaerolineae bacterium]|nr:mevalonate kinase [Anaerolineae bacterium]